MKIQQLQIKGHKKNICEDVILLCKPCEPLLNYSFIGIADGQSSRTHCIEGAKTSLKTISDYFQKQNLSSFPLRNSDEIQYEFMGVIHNLHQKLKFLASKNNTTSDEFASTICCMACDPLTGTFVLTHLGDGCILGITKDNTVKLLSQPENGFTKNLTYLTTSPDVVHHTRISHGNLMHYKCIYLMTDGAADHLFKNNFLHSEMKTMLQNQDFDALSRYLKESRPSDDASLLMITIETIYDKIK